MGHGICVYIIFIAAQGNDMESLLCRFHLLILP
jgi:hypothetical protein